MQFISYVENNSKCVFKKQLGVCVHICLYIKCIRKSLEGFTSNKQEYVYIRE